MKKETNTLIYSPSDLITFMFSPFASWMERQLVELGAAADQPDPVSPMNQLLFRKGNEHEAAFLEHLETSGWLIAEIARGPNAVADTRAAMAGSPTPAVIYQAALEMPDFAGYADFLILDDAGNIPEQISTDQLETEAPVSSVAAPSSASNPPVFEVWDTKCSSQVKPYHLVQLCCYAEMLEHMTGVRPATLRVVLKDGTVADYSTQKEFPKYLKVKQAFLDFMANWTPSNRPEPESKGNNGRWESHAEEEVLHSDHLMQVHNIRKATIARLRKAGIHTLADLATATGCPQGAILADWKALQSQAALQHQTKLLRQSNPDAPPAFIKLRQPNIPAASAGDVFFDLEGYPYVNGGLEYLWGATYLDKGNRQFLELWAHDAGEEEAALLAFLEWAHARFEANPDMHIYHYHKYEIRALERLTDKHMEGVTPYELMKKAGVFVDLYEVFKGAIQLGEPSYSLKYVEKLYRSGRGTSVATAGESITEYDRWLQSGEGKSPAMSPILKSIRDYNKDDCDSTLELAEWLRTV